ncbi:MAG: P-loop NTPase [Blastocatellia bacterium]|nr:P-loop NTPase [Blastocatellia bacterium]
MPPGTGDVQLSLAQLVPVQGAIVVTTPQDVATADVRKAINMFEQVGVPTSRHRGEHELVQLRIVRGRTRDFRQRRRRGAGEAVRQQPSRQHSDLGFGARMWRSRHTNRGP